MKAIPELPTSIRTHLLDTGLGAGNTGDDAMFLAARAQLPSEFELSTEIHSIERAAVLAGDVQYIPVHEKDAVERSIRSADLVMSVGSTVVMDQWGLDWPLRANAVKLQLCHRSGKPVHVLGAGIDRLTNRKALKIFHECYTPIASWSVRTHYCKAALLEMGIPNDKITVGADWAWLLNFRLDREWAADWLSRSGVAQDNFNIGVNVVNEIWTGNRKMKKAWAAMLDRVVDHYGARIVFFCNESRPGRYFDRAAAEDVRAAMRNPSIILENRYYQPGEMISLISMMQLTISQRYHFTLFSILADVCPISIERGQKMHGLNKDLGLPYVGNMEHIEESSIEAEVKRILENKDLRLSELRKRRRELEMRARNNLSIMRQSLPDAKSVVRDEETT